MLSAHLFIYFKNFFFYLCPKYVFYGLFRVTGVEEVNYTDQEYEDSSDCEGLPVEVPKVNRYRLVGNLRTFGRSPLN